MFPLVRTLALLCVFADGKLQKFKKPKQINFKILFLLTILVLFLKLFFTLLFSLLLLFLFQQFFLFFVSFSVFYHQKNFNLLHIICCCCFSFTVFCFVVLFVL